MLLIVVRNGETWTEEWIFHIDTRGFEIGDLFHGQIRRFRHEMQGSPVRASCLKSMAGEHGRKIGAKAVIR